MPDLPPITPQDLDAARAATVARGRVLRRRRGASIIGAGGAGVVVVALLVAGLAGGGDGDGDEVETAAARTTTTVEPSTTTSPSTSSTTSTSAVAVETTATSAPPAPTTTAPPAPTTTAPPPPEPACTTATGVGRGPDPDWAASWQAEPAFDDPATITFCVDDVTPAVGQVITATIQADDPDAPFLAECPAIVLLEGQHSLCRDIAYPPFDEPQPTPAEQPGSHHQTFELSFDAPGAVAIRGRAWSGELVRQSRCSVDPCPFRAAYSPYASAVDAELRLLVG